MTVFALDEDTGNRVALRSQVADETGVGNPAGASPVERRRRDRRRARRPTRCCAARPRRQSGGLCMHITIAERAKPLGFCNTYVGGVPGQAGVVGLARGLRRQRGRRPARRLRVRPAAREVDRDRPARAPRPGPGVPRGPARPARRAPRAAPTASRRCCGASAARTLTRTFDGPRSRGRAPRVPRSSSSAARRPTRPARRPRLGPLDHPGLRRLRAPGSAAAPRPALDQGARARRSRRSTATTA